MHNVLADSAFTVVFEFIEDGAYVEADALSVSWTLRSNTGSVLTTVAVNNADPIQRLEASVASGFNTNASTFEYRTVIVDYTVNGAARQLQQTYRVTSWLPHRAVPADVRAYIGLTEEELPDADIDLAGAYFDLADKVGAATLTSTLTAGTIASERAKLAVVATAVLRVIPSARVRARQSQKSDTASMSRFSDVKFEIIEKRAAGDVSILVDLLDTSGSDAPPLAAVYADTDAITGA